MKLTTLLALIALVPAYSFTASAGLIITASNAQFNTSGSNQMGSLEVFVQSDLATAPQLIADQVRLTLSGSGVTFTGVSTPTLHPYVFPSSSPSGSVSGGGLVLDAGDFLLSGSAPLNNGAGLFKANFSIAGGTGPSSIGVQISTNSSNTFLVDNTSTHLSFTVQNGTITLAVPEWTGSGTDGKWSTSGNWTTNPADGSSLIFSGTSQIITTNDILSSAGSITFDSTAGSFTLSGNALTISRGITNNSINTQTLNLNLTLSAAQQFNTASGNLIINGTVANGGNTLAVTGSAKTSLAGAISGGGGITKNGSGMLTLSGNNSYSGGTAVNAGTLVVGHADALGTGGLTINGTVVVQLQPGLTAPVVLSSLTIAGDTTPTSSLDTSADNLWATGLADQGQPLVEGADTAAQSNVQPVPEPTATLLVTAGIATLFATRHRLIYQRRGPS